MLKRVTQGFLPDAEQGFFNLRRENPWLTFQGEACSEGSACGCVFEHGLKGFCKPALIQRLWTQCMHRATRLAETFAGNLASATHTLHGGVGVFIEQGFFRCFHLQDHTGETLCERVVDITRQTGALFEDGSLALLLGDLLPMNSHYDVLCERLSQLYFVRPIGARFRVMDADET